MSRGPTTDLVAYRKKSDDLLAGSFTNSLQVEFGKMKTLGLTV